MPAPEEFSRMINGGNHYLTTFFYCCTPFYSTDQNGVIEQFEDLSDEMDDV